MLFAAAVAYVALQTAIIPPARPPRCHRPWGHDLKGKLSPLPYTCGVASFLSDWAAVTLYAVVAGFRLVPDRRIERAPAGSRPGTGPARDLPLTRRAAT